VTSVPATVTSVIDPQLDTTSIIRHRRRLLPLSRHTCKAYSCEKPEAGIRGPR